MPLPSKRDLGELRDKLTAWLATKLPDGAPELSHLAIPEGTGFSSETLLFDVTYDEDGERRTVSLVTRLAPESSDYPVFPTYDLQRQYEAMQFVAERTDVPVPVLRWLELDESWLGSPFFVMERVDGHAPSDNPPYVVGGWLYDATEEQRAAVERGLASVLARLHAIELTDDDLARFSPAYPGQTALDRQLNEQRAYYDWARGDDRYEVIERAFAWLEANRPTEPLPTVLNWGDARIGNILWNDFRPAAVLDWEMVTVGPPEVDVAWGLMLHAFFQSIADRYGLPGMKDFLEPERIAAEYEAAGGRPVRDLHWYLVYAALRFGIVSIRTSARAIAYGDMAPLPEGAPIDDLIMHKPLIEAWIRR